LKKNGTCFLILCLNLKMVGVAGVAGDGWGGWLSAAGPAQPVAAQPNRLEEHGAQVAAGYWFYRNWQESNIGKGEGRGAADRKWCLVGVNLAGSIGAAQLSSAPVRSCPLWVYGFVFRLKGGGSKGSGCFGGKLTQVRNVSTTPHGALMAPCWSRVRAPSWTTCRAGHLWWIREHEIPKLIIRCGKPLILR
jgi:hypothetical protein